MGDILEAIEQITEKYGMEFLNKKSRRAERGINSILFNLSDVVQEHGEEEAIAYFVKDAVNKVFLDGRSNVIITNPESFIKSNEERFALAKLSEDFLSDLAFSYKYIKTGQLQIMVVQKLVTEEDLRKDFENGKCKSFFQEVEKELSKEERLISLFDNKNLIKEAILKKKKHLNSVRNIFPKDERLLAVINEINKEIEEWLKKEIQLAAEIKAEGNLS